MSPKPGSLVLVEQVVLVVDGVVERAVGVVLPVEGVGDEVEAGPGEGWGGWKLDLGGRGRIGGGPTPLKLDVSKIVR